MLGIKGVWVCLTFVTGKANAFLLEVGGKEDLLWVGKEAPDIILAILPNLLLHRQ